MIIPYIGITDEKNIEFLASLLKHAIFGLKLFAY